LVKLKSTEDEELREWKTMTMSYRRILGLQDSQWTAAEYKRFLVENQNRNQEEPDLETVQLGSKETLENDENFKRWLSCRHS
jgi:hypothetical protein